MIFRAPASAQTPALERDGTFVLFWRTWLNAVSQWLQEASRTNLVSGAAWVQQGQIIFVDYPGPGAVSIPTGAAKGRIPAPAYDTFLTALSGASIPFLAGSTDLNLPGPAKGWYIAKEA